MAIDKYFSGHPPIDPNHQTLSKTIFNQSIGQLSAKQQDTKFYCPDGINIGYQYPPSDPDNLKYNSPKPVAAFQTPNLQYMLKVNNSQYINKNGEAAS